MHVTPLPMSCVWWKGVQGLMQLLAYVTCLLLTCYWLANLRDGRGRAVGKRRAPRPGERRKGPVLGARAATDAVCAVAVALTRRGAEVISRRLLCARCGHGGVGVLGDGGGGGVGGVGDCARSSAPRGGGVRGGSGGGGASGGGGGGGSCGEDSQLGLVWTMRLADRRGGATAAARRRRRPG